MEHSIINHHTKFIRKEMLYLLNSLPWLGDTGLSAACSVRQMEWKQMLLGPISLSRPNQRIGEEHGASCYNSRV